MQTDHQRHGDRMPKLRWKNGQGKVLQGKGRGHTNAALYGLQQAIPQRGGDTKMNEKMPSELGEYMDQLEREKGVMRRYKMLDVMVEIIRDSGADEKVILGFEICRDFLKKGENI